MLLNDSTILSVADVNAKGADGKVSLLFISFFYLSSFSLIDAPPSSCFGCPSIGKEQLVITL